MKPMSSSELGVFIAENRTRFLPGETLRVSALWALPEKPESVEVRLFWYTQGKGTQDVGVVKTERIDAPDAAGERAVTFQLPQQPWSFSGKLVSLLWAVELVVEPGGRVARGEFTLSPDGAEILLHGGGAGEGAARPAGGN